MIKNAPLSQRTSIHKSLKPHRKKNCKEIFQQQVKQLQEEHRTLAQRTQQALSEGTKELVDSLNLPERSDE